MGRLTNPLALLRWHLGAIAVAGAIIFTVVLVATLRIEANSKNADENAKAALLSAEAEGRIGDILALIAQRSAEFLASPEVMALPEEQQDALRLELSRRDFGEATPGLPDLLIPLSMQQTLLLQSSLDAMSSGIGTNLDLLSATDQEMAEELQHTGDLVLSAYYGDPTPEHLRLFAAHFTAIRQQLAARVPSLIMGAQANQASLQSATTWARIGIFIAVIGLFGFVLVFGAFMARRIRANTLRLDAESDALEKTTARLQYRNDQLNALYNVFNEITESLSLTYVIKSTVKETLQVMRAEGVVLRMLRGEDLVAVGAVGKAGREIEGIPPVKLGEGPTGRVARRGRTERLTEGAQAQLGPAPNAPEVKLESGIIVPLIVGARVVGTLSCWSSSRFAFGEEDERILEMMASQVATAIVAADTTEKNERRAMIDPLTSLPNRRQLDDDLATEAEAFDSSQTAVVAMLDIDHFKRLNDEFGHKVGDITLQKIAAVMRNAVRENDRIYRYGGEEFVIIFPDAGEDEAETLANRVRTAVESTPLSGDHLEPIGPVTISIGLALYPAHSPVLADLIAIADRAMYLAKEAGRNRVVVWDEGMSNPHLKDVA